jgi:hypothetical protein
LGVPFAPQVNGAAHVPQSSLPPQPSSATPHAALRSTHVFGVQPHTPVVPAPPQVWGAVHIPQSSIALHPSGIGPQFLPCIAQVVGLQPHLLATPPPPQALGAWQGLPQSTSLPQVSETVPHSAPRSAQVLAMHGLVPQRLGPSPPQIAGWVHDLQSIMPPQPSGKSPQFAFCASQVVGVQPQWFGLPPPPQVAPGSRHWPQSSV